MDFNTMFESGMRPGLISAAAFHSLGGAPIPESWFPRGQARTRGPDVSQTPKAQYRGDGFVPAERPTAMRQPAETLLSVDPEHIADELALAAHTTMDALAALRRHFAMRNHPDRTSAEQRDRATTRMAIANGLIDRAMKDRRARARA